MYTWTNVEKLEFFQFYDVTKIDFWSPSVRFLPLCVVKEMRDAK